MTYCERYTSCNLFAGHWRFQLTTRPATDDRSHTNRRPSCKGSNQIQRIKQKTSKVWSGAVEIGVSPVVAMWWDSNPPTVLVDHFYFNDLRLSKQVPTHRARCIWSTDQLVFLTMKIILILSAKFAQNLAKCRSAGYTGGSGGGGNPAMPPIRSVNGTWPPSRQRFLPHKNGTQPSFCLFCLLSTSINFRTHNN